jgi:hypothetical protein
VLSNAFVFFDDEHQAVISPATAPVPVPTPGPLVPAGGGRGGGGGRLTPWEPLYNPARSCSTAGIPEDVLAKIGGKKSGGERDALEVLRDVQKTKERVKRGELRALKLKVEALTQEKAALTRERSQELRDAQKRIQDLEFDISCLKAQFKDVANRLLLREKKWAPPKWKPFRAPERPAPTKKVQKPSQNVLVVRAQPLQSLTAVDGILAALPHVGGAALTALATAYLVSDESRGMKFLGYGAASTWLLFAVSRGILAARKEPILPVLARPDFEH